MSTSSDFEDLLSEFCAARVRFLVIGGYAVAYHGTPRFTKDIDLWIEPTPENARKTWSALTKFGAPLRGVKPTDFERPDIFFTFGRPPQRVDILMRVDGVDFAGAWARRKTMTYGRVLGVPVLSKRDLIDSKRASGRLIDLADVEELERRRARSERDDGSGQVSESRPRRRTATNRPRRR